MKTAQGKMYGIGILAFILFLSTLVGVPVLPALSVELGAGANVVPIVVSAALVTVVVFQLFTGFLSDRYSRKRLILVGALVGSASSFLCAAAVDWTQLLTFRIIGGIADAIAMPALLAVTATLSSDRPGRFFGILRSSQGLSFVVGPALGSVFSLISLRMPFIADGILSLLAFAAAIWLMEDYEKAKSTHDLSVFRALRSVFSNRRVYLYMLMGVSGLFAFGILYTFIPTKSQVIGLPAWQIGMILTGGALVYSLVSYCIGIISDRYERNTFVIASQVVIVMALVGLIFAEDFVTILVYYMLFCIGESTTFLLCFVYAAGAFDRKYIGTAMGAFDSVTDLSLFVGPLMAVLLYGITDVIYTVFLLAMAPAVLAFFSTMIWLPRKN